jgi:hypothetical protein
LEGVEPVWTDAHILAQIKTMLREDSKLRPILAFFESNPEAAPTDIRHRFQAYTWEDGLLRFEGAVFVPDHEELRRQILHSRHDAPAAGHQGRAKTLELVSRDFYWPTLCRYVHRYVDGCDTCQRSKPTHHARYGLLQPIPAADTPWKKVTVDFIVKLPMSSGYDSILVVVDKNTKLAHFIPTMETIGANGTAPLYLQHIWKLHGTPQDIISDRGAVFISKFMRRLCQLLCINPSITTAFHPQSNGQTERINEILEQYLRMFTTQREDDWADLLPLAEFAYNNSTHSSTGFSPFYTTYGYHPVLSFTTPTSTTVPAAEDRIRNLQEVHNEMKSMIDLVGVRAQCYYNQGV